MTKEDEILKQIERDLFVSFTKDDSQERYKALDRLRAFDLVEPHGKFSWHLTKQGYNATSIGFDKWLTGNEKQKSDISVENLSIIHGNGNNVNQSRLDNAANSTINQTTKIKRNIRSQKKSWLEIISWTAGIIVAIIALYEFWLKNILH